MPRTEILVPATPKRGDFVIVPQQHSYTMAHGGTERYTTLHVGRARRVDKSGRVTRVSIGGSKIFDAPEGTMLTGRATAEQLRRLQLAKDRAFRFATLADLRAVMDASTADALESPLRPYGATFGDVSENPSRAHTRGERIGELRREGRPAAQAAAIAYREYGEDNPPDALYRAAIAADEAFTTRLREVYGEHRAGEMRYRPREWRDPELQAAYKAWRAANDALQGNPPDAEMRRAAHVLLQLSRFGFKPRTVFDEEREMIRVATGPETLRALADLDIGTVVFHVADPDIARKVGPGRSPWITFVFGNGVRDVVGDYSDTPVFRDVVEGLDEDRLTLNEKEGG
jgi:hypothetical protein